MMKKTLTLFAVLVAITGVTSAAVDANILVNGDQSPDTIVLNASNGYEVTKTFDGTTSSSNVNYLWTNKETGTQYSTPTADYTFDQDSSSSEAIELKVSNKSNLTDQDIEQVTQFVEDRPNVTLTANTTSINEGEAVLLTATTHNSFDGTTEYNWTVGNDQKKNGSNTSSTFTATYTMTLSSDATVNFSAADDSYRNSDTVSISVSTSSNDESNDDDSGGGGGGGGGGGFSDTPSTQAPPSKTQTFFEFEPGNQSVVDIENDEEIGVKKITVNPASTVADQVSVTVTKQDGQPADVETDVGGKAYRFMEISVDGASEDDISNASIDFDVNKTWINENNINESTVRLNRYGNDSWESLPTDRTGEADESVSFQAVTTGFSYFSVSGDEETTDTTETDQDPVNDTAGNETTTDDTNTTDQDQQDDTTQSDDTDVTAETQDSGTSAWTYVGVIAALLIVLIIGAVMWRPSEDEAEEEDVQEDSLTFDVED